MKRIRILRTCTMGETKKQVAGHLITKNHGPISIIISSKGLPLVKPSTEGTLFCVINVKFLFKT